MSLTRTREGEVSSLLSVDECEALRTLMEGPAIHVSVPGAAGRLAVVWFRGRSWPVWSGVHMPLRHNSRGPAQERDVVYEWRGGSLDMPLAGGKSLAFGGHAEFVELPSGGINLTRLPIEGCETCPPGEGRTVLDERLRLDAQSLIDGHPAVAPSMRSMAGEAARAWPFSDPVLQAAAGMVLQQLGYRAH